MTDVTTSGNGATITFYPGLEAASTADDDIEFVKSTLQPHHEEMFAHLVAARAAMSDSRRYINTVQEGGAATWQDFQGWGERKLAEVLGKLERLSVPRTKRVYTRG